MSNLNGSPISGFSSLLYVNFIIKKKYRVSDIAKEMRIADDTFYRYARGENIMPPDRIIDLIKATGDSEYLDYFCEPCGYTAVPVAKGTPTPHTLERDALHLAVSAGDALKEFEKAIDDLHLDRLERRQITRALDIVIQRAANMKEKIKEPVGDMAFRRGSAKP